MELNLAHDIQDSLLQLLVELDLIMPEQAHEIFQESQETEHTPRHIIVTRELLTEDDIVEAIAGYLGAEIVDLSIIDIPQDVIQSIPAGVARMYDVFPIQFSPGHVVLATYDLMSPQVMDELNFVLTTDVSIVLARETDVKNFVNQYYGDDSESVNES